MFQLLHLVGKSWEPVQKATISTLLCCTHFAVLHQVNRMHTGSDVVQVMQAKKQLLDKLHADVASREDLPLKRMLSEDDATMKRREQCQTRVQLLKKAAEEIASVSF